MRTGRVRTLLTVILPILAVLVILTPGTAQEWRLGAQVGRIQYEGAAASATTGTSVALGVSRLSARDWIGASAGVPLNDDPYWVVAGLWKEWRQRGAHGVGLDLSGHGFIQRGSEARSTPLPLPDAKVAVEGQGAGGEASLLGFAGAGPVQLELHAGVAGQTSEVADVKTSRLLPVLQARAGTDILPVQLSAEARRWWDADSAHTYAGANAQYVADWFALWGSAGSWLTGGASGAVLAAGATVALTGRVLLEGTWREEGFDPLYGATVARSFALGLSLRVGGDDAVRAPVPARNDGDEAVVRLDGDAAHGTPRIAGDFNSWQPEPMTARDGSWEYVIRAAPGVYSYAFVNERGEWFVPESTPGRRSDGMGGWQAVLIVDE